MHHTNALRRSVQPIRNILQGNVAVCWAGDISKYWCGTGVANSVGSRYEGQRRADDSIPRASTERLMVLVE